MDVENCIQAANGFCQEGRAQVLITCSHSKILVAEQLGNGMNIGPAHPQPTRSRVPQIMISEICDLEPFAER